jgi:hypothetical protein
MAAMIADSNCIIPLWGQAERRIGVYFRAEGGWQMDAQIAQL